MRLTIESKILGQPITFTRPGESQIFADLNGEYGTLGQQLTKNGSALTYTGEDFKEFERICRNWYRRYTNSIFS